MNVLFMFCFTLSSCLDVQVVKKTGRRFVTCTLNKLSVSTEHCTVD